MPTEATASFASITNVGRFLRVSLCSLEADLTSSTFWWRNMTGTRKTN